MTRANGFTLVELLVAMVAGSMLLAGLGWIVATLGTQLRSTGNAMISQDLSGVRILTSLIAHADASPASIAAFRGEPGHLVMVVPAPQALGDDAPVQLDLTVEHRGAGDAVVARFTPVAHGELPSVAAAGVTIAARLKQASFDYGPPADPDHASLPRFVTIHLQRAAAEETRITVAPRINTDGSCRFDPISQACR